MMNWSTSRPRWRALLLSSLWLALAAGCGARAAGGAKAGATGAGKETGTSADGVKEPPAEIDEQTAQAIIDEIERFWPKDDDSPLVEPQSLEDVEAVLKLDQVNLFGAAVEFAAQEDSLDAKVLHGQIELAWGETYMLLMEILVRLRDGFVESADELAQKNHRSALDSAAAEEAQWLSGSAESLALRIEALKLASIDHIARGFSKAEEVLEEHPDSYVGYRLAADYYRILREWDRFNDMVDKIRAFNPESNGLLFLLGAHAFQTAEDRTTAEGYYRQALENDPLFVRAQAHMLIIQSEIARTYEELLALEEMNPHHQFVALAGEAIKKAYARWKVKQAGGTAQPGLHGKPTQTSGGLEAARDLGLEPGSDPDH